VERLPESEHLRQDAIITLLFNIFGTTVEAFVIVFAVGFRTRPHHVLLAILLGAISVALLLNVSWRRYRSKMALAKEYFDAGL
jgi:hypothetical protein